MQPYRVLVVDLNNFARYPTVAVGYLVSVLRAAGHDVTVLSPLFHGVPGIEREPSETSLRSGARRLNYLLAQAPRVTVGSLRRTVDWGRKTWAQRHYSRIVESFERSEPERYDAVLVSAYLMYHPVCETIGERCRALGLPLLVGGSYFASNEVAASWIGLPGLTALIGGEVELELPALLSAAIEGGDLTAFSGVWLPDGNGGPRAPLQELDRVPFPDYRDFPWHLYPNRIVPMITGRGCGWGACSFCSDVTSTAGRTFRSRSPDNVLDEIELQARRHHTRSFVFTDLKLNSSLDVWEALIARIQARAPGARWIGAVHAGAKQPNGLDRALLDAAQHAGLRRLTTGLESGSQKVLEAMKKGTDLQVTSRFLHDAAAAGVSVRVTMIHGFPGEQVEDVLETAEYLERHTEVIDRVLLNRFQIMIGPTFLRRYDADPSRFAAVRRVERRRQLAIASHEYTPAQSLGYARATQRLLSAVHAINRRPLAQSAAEFEGVM